MRVRCTAQAMSLMLPKNTPRRQLPDDTTLESRMDCMKVCVRSVMLEPTRRTPAG